MRGAVCFAGLLVASTVAAEAAAPAAVAPPAAQVDAGRRLFARCAGCHQIGPNAGNVFGPHLNGVIGRKAGSVAGYGYSPALKASSLVWNAQNLAAFIDDSGKVIPGNKMRFFSFLNQKQIADIVAYMGTQRAPAATPVRAAKP